VRLARLASLASLGHGPQGGRCQGVVKIRELAQGPKKTGELKLCGFGSNEQSGVSDRRYMGSVSNQGRLLTLCLNRYYNNA
jgi:hypothetical protein